LLNENEINFDLKKNEGTKLVLEYLSEIKELKDKLEKKEKYIGEMSNEYE